jgi:hypothetical protein
VDDDKLYLPSAPGDSVTKLMRRVGGISDTGTAVLMPGWDWEVIMCGLAGAIGRYRTGLGNSKGIEIRAAVGEALWWLAAADEFLRKRVSSGLKAAEFYSEIKRTSAGRRFAGLVFLRNRTGHQFAAALMQVVATGSTTIDIMAADGSTFPNTIVVDQYGHMKPFDDSPEDGYYFAPASLLPAADAGFGEKYHRDEWYDELVAKRRVIDILESIHSSLGDAISIRRKEGNIHFAFDIQRSLPALWIIIGVWLQMATWRKFTATCLACQFMRRRQTRRGVLPGVPGTLLVVRRIHYPRGPEVPRSQTRVLAGDPSERHQVLRAVRLQLLHYLFPDQCAFALSISCGRRFSEAGF